MTRKDRFITGRFAGIILAVSVLVYWLNLHTPANLAQLVKSDHAQLLTGSMPQERLPVQLLTEYLRCGHSVAQGVKEITPEELLQFVEENPNSEIREENGKVTVILTEEGLCPTDEKTRTLGVKGDYLAIFKGPAYLNEVEKIIQIRIDELPENWQELLAEGALEFENETALLEALDSLDEYQTQNY